MIKWSGISAEMKNMSKIVLNLRKTWARARAWFHACPDGEGWVWRRTSRWRMWQARLSHRSRGLRLSRDCHKRYCHKVVTRLSQARLSRRSRGLRGHRWSPHYTSGVEERVSNWRQSGGSLPNGGADPHKRHQKSRKRGHFPRVKKLVWTMPSWHLIKMHWLEGEYGAHLLRGAFLKLAAYSPQSPVEHLVQRFKQRLNI